jgi:hypothetical protein
MYEFSYHHSQMILRRWLYHRRMLVLGRRWLLGEMAHRGFPQYLTLPPSLLIIFPQQSHHPLIMVEDTASSAKGKKYFPLFLNRKGNPLGQTKESSLQSIVHEDIAVADLDANHQGGDTSNHPSIMMDTASSAALPPSSFLNRSSARRCARNGTVDDTLSNRTR